jgi:inhibitor of cysteine peptidase
MLADTPKGSAMRLSVLVSLALVALAVSPLVACSQSTEEAGEDGVVTPDGEETTEDELRSLSLTEKDDGKTVTVTEGQNLVVKLQSNPTTGYKWKVVSTDRTFGYPADERFLRNTDAVGSGGLQRFSWKTKGALSMVGDHTVKMEYKRSWETNASPAKTFSFTVKILGGECPQLSPPAPNFCPNGTIKAKKNAAGCTTGFECQEGCGGRTCSSGQNCQYCWGSLACVPNGALC